MTTEEITPPSLTDTKSTLKSKKKWWGYQKKIHQNIQTT